MEIKEKQLTIGALQYKVLLVNFSQKNMNTRLKEWAEREHILTDAQFGFKKR